MAMGLSDINLYHITHVSNLPSIIEDGELLCDAEIIKRGGPKASIGMKSIKRRRLELRVKCYPTSSVGEYVPFYFCPRSIMLYLLHCGNHPDLDYYEGQEPIVHLEASLHEVVVWADKVKRQWAFTLSNAGAVYAEFRNQLEQLDEIDWEAVFSNDFRDPHVKEGKQAEFLVYCSVPWHLIRRIGVCSERIRVRVLETLSKGGHRPVVEVRPE